jgi:DNA-binding transcriptional ArsR family regulator
VRRYSTATVFFQIKFDIHIGIYNYMVVDSLNLTFVALSDPTRRIILDRLRKAPATVSELAEPFGISQQAISKHLAYLERAKLIEKRKEGRQHFCSLNRGSPSLREAHDWMEGYCEFWEEAFGRMDVLLEDLKQKKHKDKKNAGGKQ